MPVSYNTTFQSIEGKKCSQQLLEILVEAGLQHIKLFACLVKQQYWGSLRLVFCSEVLIIAGNTSNASETGLTCLHVYNEYFYAVQYIWDCFPSCIRASHSKCTDWRRDSKERSLRVWELEKSLINKVALHQKGVGGVTSLLETVSDRKETPRKCVVG